MNTRLATKTKAAIIAAAISLLALTIGIIWMMTPHGSSNVSEHVLDKRSVTKLDNAVQDAVELNRESFRASFNARPSYQTDETGKRKTMAILDTDSSPWDAGTYQLTVYCMGSGTLNASFSIGEQYEDCTVSCTDDIAQETLTIRTEGASEGQVSIVPSEDSVSEIAYWINHPNN